MFTYTLEYRRFTVKKFLLLILISVALSVLYAQNTSAQSNPTVSELNNFLNNSEILLTYRKGEAVYGTFYFITIHYCPSALYGLYGNSEKHTIMGNKQKNNWREFGSWKVLEYNGKVGVYYKTTNAQENFVPVYRLPNGNLSIGEGSTILKKGQATCN